MSRLIGGSKYDKETKITKLHAFFKGNEQQLQNLGPEIYLAVKNELGDVIKGVLNGSTS